MEGFVRERQEGEHLSLDGSVQFLFLCFCFVLCRCFLFRLLSPPGSDPNSFWPCLQPYMKMAEDDKKRYQDELAGNQVGGDDDEGDEEEADS